MASITTPFVPNMGIWEGPFGRGLTRQGRGGGSSAVRYRLRMGIMKTVGPRAVEFRAASPPAAQKKFQFSRLSARYGSGPLGRVEFLVEAIAVSVHGCKADKGETMNRALVLIFIALLTGCATQSQHPIVWVDVTGNGRPDSVLFQDHSACLMTAQQARAQAEQLFPPPSPTGYCPTCGAINYMTIMMRQNNINQYAQSAFINCMGANGWRRQ